MMDRATVAALGFAKIDDAKGREGGGVIATLLASGEKFASFGAEKVKSLV